MERDTYFAEMDNLDEAAEIHKAYSEYKKEFSSDIANVNSIANADKKTARLWEIVNASVTQADGSRIKQTDLMDSGQFMLVFNSFRNMGKFQDMIDLYDRCPNKDFTDATLVKELLALAYVKTGAPIKALEVTHDLIERAHTPLFNHLKRGEAKTLKPVHIHSTHAALKNAQDARYAVLAGRRRVSSTTYEMQGRAYRLLADKEKNGGKKQALLEKSVKALEDGFEATLDASVGLMALHRNIELGRTEKAEKTAELVYLAALRDGAEEMRLINGEEKLTSRDFGLLNTALQAGILSGRSAEEMQTLTERLERCPARRWQLDDLAESLTLIADKHPSEQLKNLLTTLRQKKKAYAFTTVMEPLTKGVYDLPEKQTGENADNTARDAKIAAIKAKARKLAPAVAHDNMMKSHNPYMLAQAVKIGAILDYNEEAMSRLRKTFIESNPPHWMIASTQGFLETLAAKTAEPNSPESIRIREQAAILGGYVTKSEKEKSENQAKLDALYATTYSYRGLASRFEGSSRVSGNMQFGGQLPDHAVSKKDLELFSGLLRMPLKKLMPQEKIPQDIDASKPMSSITDTDKFLKAADAFVRYHFGTDNFAKHGFSLEDNALMCGSDGLLKGTKGGELQYGSLYDQTVDGMMHVCGKQKGKEANAGIDSRTNISAIFLLGMGDCRHHAQVKQILFDMWQKKQMNDTLRTALRAAEAGNAPAHDAAVQQFDRMYRTELRTTDVKVNMPIVMEQDSNDKGEKWDLIYRPELTTDKKFKKKERDSTLEEHTMTVLMTRDENGELKKFDLRDAFYQNTYDWGDKNIPLSAIELKDGKPKVAVGFVKKDKVANGEDVPIHLEPTSYNTGRRDTAVNDSTGEDVCVMGIRVRGLESPARFAAQLRDRDRMIDKLHEVLHTEQTVYQPRAQEKEQQQEEKKEQKDAPETPKKNYTAIYAAAVSNRVKHAAQHKVQAPEPKKASAILFASRKDRSR